MDANRTDAGIARGRELKHILEIAAEIGLGSDDLDLYGAHQAKVRMPSAARILANGAPPAPLVLVSSMTPTAAGAGKTTCGIGLAQALRAIGKRACVTLREPSMGPVFGRKGGAAGGGYSQVLPMEAINLHFTGDMHAITAANNLIAAIIENELHFDNQRHLSQKYVLWRRCMDMNDRALRRIVSRRSAEGEDSPFAERAFEITAASTVMAALCLSRTYGELKEKIGDILVGFTEGAEPVTGRDLGIQGAATALLKQALQPNLAQTYEYGPAFVHGGPFANIAQGTCSVLSMQLARKLSDYVVTEAGFGFDLGGEKFLDLVGPYAGLSPSVVVLVATVKSLKLQGGASNTDLDVPDPGAVTKGAPNLRKHIENVRKFGLEPVVAINRFVSDAAEELRAVEAICDERDVASAVVDYRERGGEGGTGLAEEVVAAVDRFQSSGGGDVTPIYDWAWKVEDKIATIAREIYGAESVNYSFAAREDLRRIYEYGDDKLPICMAKTHSSLSDQSDLLGRPEGFSLNVRNITLSRGGGFLIPMTGKILRMPGLPRRPAALDIDIDEDGRITGLF